MQEAEAKIELSEHSQRWSEPPFPEHNPRVGKSCAKVTNCREPFPNSRHKRRTDTMADPSVQRARAWLERMPFSLRLLAAGTVLPEGVNMEAYVAQIDPSLLQSALGQTQGVPVRAADVLGISYRFSFCV